MLSIFPSFTANRKENFIEDAEGVVAQHAVYMSGLKYTESISWGKRMRGFCRWCEQAAEVQCKQYQC